MDGDEGEDESGGENEHGGEAENGRVTVWLVERTYSDDEQNLIILVYATTDGRRYLRKERALPSFTTERTTTAGLVVSPDRLGTVGDETTREQYATAAKRMADEHEPDDEM